MGYQEEIFSRAEKQFVSEDKIFGHINKGNRIFIGTGCGKPQYLVNALTKYVESHPKAFFDTEVLHVWSLGVSSYIASRIVSKSS